MRIASDRSAVPGFGLRQASWTQVAGFPLARQNHSLPVWMDLYQTRLTDQIIDALIEFLRQTGKRTLKLGLVGCSFTDERRINRRLKESGDLAGLPVKFFSDPEAAKTWLVSEHG